MKAISQKSVAKANYNVTNGRSCVTARTKDGIVAEFRTTFGSARISVSHKKVAEAGAKVLKAYSR